jgi:hypothetical protein
MRIPRMGFAGVAVATTFAGEFTVVLFPGLEMVSGKSEPGGGGGSCAGGAGKELVCGFQVGGFGVGEGPGDGEGVGEGDADGVGVGMDVGVGVGAPGVGVGLGMPATVVLDEPPPHPATSTAAANRQTKKSTKRMQMKVDECEDETFTLFSVKRNGKSWVEPPGRASSLEVISSDGMELWVFSPSSKELGLRPQL